MSQNTESRIFGTSTKCLLLNKNNWPRISGPVTQNFWLTNHGFQNFWNLHKLALILKKLVPEDRECPQHFYIIPNIDSRISKTRTKCLFDTKQQLVQNFWTSHTEFLTD